LPAATVTVKMAPRVVRRVINAGSTGKLGCLTNPFGQKAKTPTTPLPVFAH